MARTAREKHARGLQAQVLGGRAVAISHSQCVTLGALFALFFTSVLETVPFWPSNWPRYCGAEFVFLLVISILLNAFNSTHYNARRPVRHTTALALTGLLITLHIITVSLLTYDACRRGDELNVACGHVAGDFFVFFLTMWATYGLLASLWWRRSIDTAQQELARLIS